MPVAKHIVIVAGEESGDQHAARFIRQLKQRHPDLKCTGIGGQHMQDAGVELVSDLARYGVTGLSEVVAHIRVIRQAFNALKAHLKATKPDVLILVDYPGFNLRLAKYVKKTYNIRIVYYISPQIWAWKAKRIHTIRQYIDKMAVILPFEKKIYEQAGVPVAFVGHPLVERLENDRPIRQLKQDLALPCDKTILAILPGSRQNEIKRHMPVLRQLLVKLGQNHSDVHVVIPVARSLSIADIQSYLQDIALPVTFIDQQALEVVRCCDFVIVASGTASLECALLTRPMCIIYKVSLLTFMVAAHYMRVKYLGLCNLLQNKMIVPEFLQYDCTAEELHTFLSPRLFKSDLSNAMISRLEVLKESLSQQQADMSMCELIEEELGYQQDEMTQWPI